MLFSNAEAGKDCRRCYTWKPLLDYYSKGKSTADGKDSMCKVCFKERKAARASGVKLTRCAEHRMTDGIELKLCPTCKEWVDVAMYSKCAKRSDGLQGLCKTCLKVSRSKCSDSRS